jgi:hypothetical protein
MVYQNEKKTSLNAAPAETLPKSIFEPRSTPIGLLAFSDETKAIQFESYLKSGSGRAFAKKRLWRHATAQK